MLIFDKFVCFRSESAGFLKRHVNVHEKLEYPWPPVYVGGMPTEFAAKSLQQSLK